MRWLPRLLGRGRRHTEDVPSVAVDPTGELCTDDLAEAIQARRRADRAVQETEERWSRVNVLVRRLETLHRRNHLAADVEKIFGG